MTVPASCEKHQALVGRSVSEVNGQIWLQKQMSLSPRSRGFHLITREILTALPELRQMETGLLHIFILHTSASLTINENADPDVRVDLEASLHAIAPESFPYVHTCEGPDDMPAHVKASLLGASLSVPVHRGELLLGTWQGIYLGEHRERGGSRRIVLTLQGTSTPAH
ncbi:MAG: secondary thiamine-phosphate synthase enzyme YjbQ [Planctomycetaceae bacterium]|nr:secondary thiamine-phosphate synthase enzyme YjbQ [Planctomycetaceae bacterium]